MKTKSNHPPNINDHYCHEHRVPLQQPYTQPLHMYHLILIYYNGNYNSTRNKRDGIAKGDLIHTRHRAESIALLSIDEHEASRRVEKIHRLEDITSKLSYSISSSQHV